MTEAAGLAERGIEVIRRARGKASNVAGWAAVLIAVLGMAAPAAAIDFFDGRIQVHGFYEQDIRSLWQNFDPKYTWDLSQWQHILDIEIDTNIAPDGWGPFDSISGFTRAEVRFDCVWTRGCGLMQTADAYGDRAVRAHDPNQSGQYPGFAGAQYTGDNNPFRYASLRDYQAGKFGGTILTRSGYQAFGPGLIGPKNAELAWNTQTFGFVFNGGLGPDGLRGTFDNPGDDPGWRMYGVFFGKNGRRCLFGSRNLKAGNPAGFVSHDLPLNPGCTLRNIGSLRNYPNPWNPNGDPNPQVLGATPPGGFPAAPLPFRPNATLPSTAPNRDRSVSQGAYYPTPTLARRLKHEDFGATDVNYTQNQLQWNRGASQQETYELKEAYLDLEMFDSRLWLRAGKQEIVWGKTELFRNQDRFNPQDLALSTLPTLEESRIPLWALRGVWSFYEVGPLSDVRLEGALDLNDFQPNDLGRCGEPYTPLVVCDKSYGLLTHGYIGIGLEGEIRPPRIFHDWSSLQGGARLEWRYDRFSFALTDYYGFNPTPIAPVDFHYYRNVDEVSGRPRLANAVGPCRTGTEASCLVPNPGSPSDPALTHAQVNETVYAWLCANTVGLVKNLLGAADCPLIGVFNSLAPLPGLPISLAFGVNAMMSGSVVGQLVWGGLAQCGNAPGSVASCGTAIQNKIAASGANPALFSSPFGATPLARLSIDSGDPAAPLVVNGLDQVTTPQQQALLGCGPYYARDCDTGLRLSQLTGAPVEATPSFAPGIDLLNAEASVLLQSFTGFEGTLGTAYDTTNPNLTQPGTVGFQGGPVATRYVGNLQNVQLPGSRGPGDPGYNPAVDGTTTGPDSAGNAAYQRVQPFTNQPFRNELAALSFNLEMVLTALNVDPLATAANPLGADPTRFDPYDPFGDLWAQQKPGIPKCSIRYPANCIAVSGLLQEAMTTRPTVKAGGNGNYGRFDFLWATGYEQYITYAKTNVLGFSTDFAEDRTKTNWSVEFTWENNLPVANLFSPDQITDTDLYNLTISVDRPTFINFLNANRTFFFNSQLFIQYVSNYQKGFQMEGPYNFLWTIAVNTGYFQDRLIPSLTLVWDFNSDSGAFLPQVAYRFTENFSATFGVSVFSGRWDRKNGGITNAVDRIAVDRGAQNSYVENGLTAVQDRDEIFMKIRYTF